MPMESSLAPLGKYLGSCVCSSLGSLGSHFQAIVVPWRCHRIAADSNYRISCLTYLIEVFLSILKSARHMLRIVDGRIHVTSSLDRWEAFPTHGALSHNRITWALSPMAPQVAVVIVGPLYVHGVLGTLHGEVRNFIGQCVLWRGNLLVHFFVS